MSYLPAEFKQCLGGMGDASFGPGQEVELGDSPCLSGFHILQVETSHQVVITPNVFAHQVHL